MKRNSSHLGVTTDSRIPKDTQEMEATNMGTTRNTLPNSHVHQNQAKKALEKPGLASQMPGTGRLLGNTIPSNCGYTKYFWSHSKNYTIESELDFM